MATFSDDFNRADNADLGPGWVEVDAGWSIVSNQLSAGSLGGTLVLRAATAMASSDHYAQVQIAAGTSGSRGVWCRGNATLTSGYVWRNNGSSWNLFSVVGGSFSDIGGFAGAAVVGDVAKVQAVGSTITGFVNGVARVVRTNTAVVSGTAVGVRSDSTSSVRYDAFAAADVAASAALGTAAETDTAQAASGAKTSTAGTATETDAARPVTGGKTGAAGTAGSTEAAQPAPGAKSATPGAAGATETAQPATGAKTGPLGITGEQDTAQPLTGRSTAALTPATETDTAQPPTGAKTAPLGTAGETDTARPLTVPGDLGDVDVTVGAPYSPWIVGTPRGSGWEVGAPV